MCCHPSDRLLICCPSMTDLSHAAILLTDFSCCFFQQTLVAATSNRLYLLPHSTDFRCCHFRQTLDSATFDRLLGAASSDRLWMPSLSTDFTIFLRLPWHSACFKLSCVATLWAHTYPLLWARQHHMDRCSRPDQEKNYTPDSLLEL